MTTLTEAEADLLIENDKEITAEIEWRRVNGSEAATVRVKNSSGRHLELRLRVQPKAPEQLHLVLLDSRQPLRRLDVRDGHTNPDGTRWEHQTHKHRWTDLHGDGEAYTPSDIPEPDGDVTPDHYREIVEAFCQECNIDHAGLVWTDPDMREEI